MTTMSMPLSKRTATHAFGQSPFDLSFQQSDPYWPDTSDVLLPSTTFEFAPPTDCTITDSNKRQKRDSEVDFPSYVVAGPPSDHSSFSEFLSPIDSGIYPHFTDDLEMPHVHHVVDIPQQGLFFDKHPFLEIAGRRHKSLRQKKSVRNGANSYIKLPTAIQEQFEKAGSRIVNATSKPVFRGTRPRTKANLTRVNVQRSGSTIPVSPPDFGSAQRLDGMDKSLRTFYVNCMCPGRTLLPATNGWLRELLPMSDSDPVVHHALLAFSAGYCLEYIPVEKLLHRANEHYKRASELLMERLANGVITGYEDSVVGALRLMWCDDIVQWELRRPKHQIPRWFEAAQLAKQIMRTTDTGYRYWQPEKRQCTPARVSNANMLALIDIVAATVSPLTTEEESTETPHPWLLAGDSRDANRIHGGTGLSPKLLHMIAQITQTCAVMSQDPDSVVMPLFARNLENRILQLSQWSELCPESFGRPITTAQLLETCHFDENGLAATEIAVTDLTAQAWLEAARLYLRLRFNRLPRQHANVQEPFRALGEILRRLPCSGKLFTSQSPFYPMFLYGIAAVAEESRSVARHWFKTVVERVTSRSSVPPVWRVLQKAWLILDTEDQFLMDPDVDHKAIGRRTAWWELLVERWRIEEGMLCIV